MGKHTRLVAVSQWCAQETMAMHEYNPDKGDDWLPIEVSGHDWCREWRWHDEYHGKNPGCCASPEERESWACECECHG